MAMVDREKPSWAIRIFGPLLFITGALGALVWFFNRVSLLISGMSEDVVVVDKGSFYMLGVGVGLLALSMAGILEAWFLKTLTKKNITIISRTAIIGVILTFTTPHLIDYLSSNTLQNEGYSICEEASHQWLFSRYIVYVQDSVICIKGLRDTL